MKKRGVIILIIIISLIVIFLIKFQTDKTKNIVVINNISENRVNEYSQNLQNETKINTSTKLKEVRKIEEIEISNVQLTNKNGKCILIARAKNIGDKKTEVSKIEIIIYNDNNQEIGKIKGIVPPLEKGEEKHISTTMQEDYTNAYDYKVQIE